MRSATNTTPATLWPRSARSLATTRRTPATSSTNRESGIGWKLDCQLGPPSASSAGTSPASGEATLLFRVAAVEQVGGDQCHDHDAGRPSEARPEGIVVRQVDADRKSTDGGKHHDDEHATHGSVLGEEEFDLELPARTVPWPVSGTGRGVRGDALAPPQAVAGGGRKRCSRQALDLAVGRRRHLQGLP